MRKIKRLKLIKIDAYQTSKKQTQNIKISHKVNINKVNGNIVKFTYVADYGKYGKINVIGEMECENIENPQEEEYVFLMITHYCIPLAVIISRELSLPPPIPLPTIKFKNDKKK